MRHAMKNKTVQDGIAVLLLALALGVRSLIGFLSTGQRTAWILSPWLFPLLLALIGLPLAAALLRRAWRESGLEADEAVPAVSAPGQRRMAALVLLTAAYLVLMGPIRFVPATMLYLAALIRLLGERRRGMIAAVAVLTPLALYALFALALSVRLP